MIKTTEVKWEYEDELPELEDDEFDAIFPASRVIGNEWGGVRMYPYVEADGERLWLTSIPENVKDTHEGHSKT